MNIEPRTARWALLVPAVAGLALAAGCQREEPPPPPETAEPVQPAPDDPYQRDPIDPPPPREEDPR
jgi:hypothetical protein